MIPFDFNGGTLAVSAERSKDGEDLQRVNYSRAVPVGGGVGYNLGYATGGARDAYRQADVTWRLQSVQLQAGVYGSSGEMTRWADASGSLVWMDAGVFAANRIDDAFVVVSTNGYGDVPVSYENQVVGRTDAKGHLLVPYSSGYYRGKYQIDPMDLPPDVLAPQVEQRVAVRRGSGYLLEFPLHRVLAAVSNWSMARVSRSSWAARYSTKKAAARRWWAGMAWSIWKICRRIIGCRWTLSTLAGVRSSSICRTRKARYP